MRSFTALYSKMWIAGTGKRLIEQYGPNHLLVAINLFSSPQSHMSGLYWCPLQYIADQVGLNLETVSAIIAGLEREGFCRYDGASSLIWVVSMFRYQVGEAPKPTDNRVRSVLRHVKGLPRSILISEFLDHYMLDPKGLDEGASLSPRVPSCVPSPSPHSVTEEGGGA